MVINAITTGNFIFVVSIQSIILLTRSNNTISIVKILSNQMFEINFFYLKQAVEDGSSAAGHVDDGAGEPGKKY